MANRIKVYVIGYILTEILDAELNNVAVAAEYLVTTTVQMPII